MTLRPPVPFQWKGNHHSYYGIFFIVFGALNWYLGLGNGNLESMIPLWEFFVLLGSGFVVDDVIEHKVTADTPLRILYEKMFKQR